MSKQTEEKKGKSKGIKLYDIEKALSKLEEITKTLNELKIALESREIREAIDFYEKQKSCGLEYTWVKGGSGKQYYYYYLKCKENGHTVSIYLGNNLDIESYNKYKRISKRLFELKQFLENFIENSLEDMETLLNENK